MSKYALKTVACLSSLSAMLVMAGCRESLGSVSELFDSVFGGSGSSEIVVGLASGAGTGPAGGDGGSGGIGSGLTSGDGGSGGTGGGGSGLVATVHQPELSSVVLFGGGLAGLLCLRRRKGRRSSS